MRKRIEWQWEVLDSTTARAKVIGGWIINHFNSFSDGKKTEISEAMVFVPDRDHEWTIIAPIATTATVKKEMAKDFESPAS